MLRHPPDPESVLAWFIGEGDVLAGGLQVVAVHREAVDRTVRILDSAGHVAQVPHDREIRVVRRGH